MDLPAEAMRIIQSMPRVNEFIFPFNLARSARPGDVTVMPLRS